MTIWLKLKKITLKKYFICLQVQNLDTCFHELFVAFLQNQHQEHHGIPDTITTSSGSDSSLLMNDDIDIILWHKLLPSTLNNKKIFSSPARRAAKSGQKREKCVILSNLMLSLVCWSFFYRDIEDRKRLELSIPWVLLLNFTIASFEKFCSLRSIEEVQSRPFCISPTLACIWNAIFGAHKLKDILTNISTEWHMLVFPFAIVAIFAAQRQVHCSLKLSDKTLLSRFGNKSYCLFIANMTVYKNVILYN